MVNTEVGDRIVIMNPWTLRLSIILIFIIGVVVGVSITYFSALHIIEVAGQSFKVESVNMTVSINQSMIMDALERINSTRIK